MAWCVWKNMTNSALQECHLSDMEHVRKEIGEVGR
jgi:hypothetical protein